MIAIPAKKTYSGRLAFDPDSGFHTAENGKRVVTEDGGASWRYAVSGDTSHLERYHERIAQIDSTENELARLQFEHGQEQARALVSPHHFEAQPDDPHYSETAPLKAAPRVVPDVSAATVTGHTDAWKQDVQ